MCRRWHGSLGAYVGGKPADYRLEGEEHLRWYASSGDAERGFCGQCGSKLFWRAKDGSAMDVTAGSVDQPIGISTTAHIWVRDKGDYYGLPDDAPCFVQSAGEELQNADPHPPAAREIAERHCSCLCGAISFDIAGKMRDVADKIAWYRSSDSARRGFCRECGSNLFWEGTGRDYVSIAAGALDLPTGLVTARHIFVETKGDYYGIGDGAAQSSGSMAANPVTF